MTYCTLDDIKKVIPEANIIQLTDDANIGVVDTVITDESISYADEIINGYLRGRYTLPLVSTPGLINKIACDLAVFFLYSRRFETDMPEAMRDRYKDAIRLLSEIQKGRLSLGIETLETTGERIYKTNKTDSDRLFKMEDLTF